MRFIGVFSFLRRIIFTILLCGMMTSVVEIRLWENYFVKLWTEAECKDMRSSKWHIRCSDNIIAKEKLILLRNIIVGAHTLT